MPFARRLSLALLLMLSAPALATRPATPAASPSPAGRKLIADSARKLIDEGEKTDKNEPFKGFAQLSAAAEVLALGTKDPLVHDPAIALLAGRLALLSAMAMDGDTAAVMVAECLIDNPNDAALKDMAEKLKKVSSELGIKICKDEREALIKARIDMKAGKVEAFRIAGASYAFSKGTLRDTKEGVKLLEMAAGAGDGDAMGSLGIIEDVESKKLVWFEKSFRAGYAQSAMALAEIYLDDAELDDENDVKRDADKAHLWLRAGFHAGTLRAPDELAKLYDDPKFPKHNAQIALSYWRVAATGISFFAVDVLKKQNTSAWETGIVVDRPKRVFDSREPAPITLEVMVGALNTPAYGKFEKGDIITAIDNTPFNSEVEFDRLIQLSKDGKVTVSYTRNGEKRTETLQARLIPHDKL